jgi:purine-cytosine permease-like protein
MQYAMDSIRFEVEFDKLLVLFEIQLHSETSNLYTNFISISAYTQRIYESVNTFCLQTVSVTFCLLCILCSKIPPLKNSFLLME